MKEYLLTVATFLVSVTGVTAQSMDRVSVHDPSIVEDNGTYYIFGSHRAAARSTNLMSWQEFTAPWATANSTNAANAQAFTTPQVTKVKKGGIEFDLNFNAFAWSKRGNAAYNVDGMMWDPDVIFNKSMQKWCMYLSINGDNWYSSVIMLTADKITGPYRYQAPVVISGFHTGNAYKDTDLEIVLGAQATLPARYAVGSKWGNRYPNCIDPCVFYDEGGKLWMSYGSWSGGIWMLELDEETGLRDYDVTYNLTGNGDGITVDPYFGKKIAGGYYVSGEASYIEYIGGYYYLFVSYGGLAAGGTPANYNYGGYQMRVFRSQNPDGPYVDSRNVDAVFANYKLNFGPKANDDRGVNIFGAYGEWGYQTVGNYGERSQGSNSILAAEDGRTYLVYHTRFQNWGEGHQVRVHQVFQNEDGWLVAAPFEYTGETVTDADIAKSQIFSYNEVAGHYKLLVHNYRLDHTAKALATPVDVVLNADGTVTGSDYSGKWTVRDDASYITLKLGAEYKGVVVEQTMEPTTEKVISFTALNSETGVTIWGYKYAYIDTGESSKCAKPTIGYSNNRLTFSCETAGATCQYSITDDDVKAGSGSELQLTVTYHISAYATKSGMLDSDVATATLCWIDKEADFSTDISPAAELKATPVLIQSAGGTLTIQGAADGTPISVFTTAGMQAGSTISRAGLATLSTNLTPGSIAIIKIGNRSVKVVLK